MQTKRRPFHVKRTGQLPVLRLFSASSSFWLAATLSSHCMTPSGQRRWTRVGLLVLAQAQNDRSDRLAQARLWRGVVIGDVEPLPFERAQRVPIACELVRMSSGLTRQCPPSSKGQPVVAVARGSGREPGASPGLMTRMSGRGSPTRSTAVSPSRPGLAELRAAGFVPRSDVPSLRAQDAETRRRLARRRPGSPSRSGRPSRSRSIACAARQLAALIGQDFEGWFESSPPAVLSVCVAPGKHRPGRAGGDQVGAAVRIEVGRQEARDACCRGNRPSIGNLVKLAQPVVEQWRPAVLFSAVRTRSRSRSLSMSSRAIPVCARRPAQKRVGLRPRDEGECQALLRLARLTVSRGDRRPALDRGGGCRIGLTIVAIDGIRADRVAGRPCRSEGLVGVLRPRSSSRRRGRGRHPGPGRASAP